jgi:hypothetical protein
MIPTDQTDPGVSPHDRTDILCGEYRPVLVLELGEHYDRNVA